MHDRPDYQAVDPNFEDRVRSSFGRQSMMTTLGISIVDLGPGWFEVEFAHSDQLTQHHGYAHAGLLATAMDSACGYAAQTLLPPNTEVLTVEYKINFLRPAEIERFRAIATVTKPGRTLSVCEAVTTVAGKSKPLATMTGTLIAVADD